MINPYEKIECPVCLKFAAIFYKRVHDDRYGYPGNFDLFRCNNCRHIFLDARFSQDELTDLYTSYYPRSDFDINHFVRLKERKGLSSWLRGYHFSAYTYVPRNVRILDIGCGFGETLVYHRERGCEVYGSEMDQNAAFFSAKFGLNIRIGPYESNNYEKDFFDYITLDQVIEHVSDPIRLLEGLHANLKEGGMAIVSSPNVHGWGVKWYKSRWLHWHAPYHLHFFSKKSLRIAAKKAGFKIIKVKSATLSDWLYWQWIHLLFFPESNQPSLFWKYMKRDIYSESQIKKLRILEKIRKCRINDLITRFFDLLKMGDNRVFVLTKI